LSTDRSAVIFIVDSKDPLVLVNATTITTMLFTIVRARTQRFRRRNQKYLCYQPAKYGMPVTFFATEKAAWLVIH